jgi:hypothetical protein
MEKARERLQQVQDRLKLSPEQLEQVRPVLIDELQRMKAVRDKYRADDNGDQSRRGKLKMAREIRGIEQDADDKLKKILTPAQMDELKKIREEWRAEMRERASQR